MTPSLFDESGLAAIYPARFAHVMAQASAHLRAQATCGAVITAEADAAPRPRTLNDAGVAVLPIQGVITKAASFWSEIFGGTSLASLNAQIAHVASDPTIRAVVLHVDSPGGGVYGVDETAEQIAALNKAKPVVAFVDGLAASACYWLIAGASQIVASPSSELGSIGVYAVHLDHSGELDKAGIVPTLIKAGEFKAEANPYQPLSEEDHAAMQARIDGHYTRFVSRVARGRGVTAATVRNDYGRGRVVLADDAMANGMANEIGTFHDAVAIALKEARTRTHPQASRSVRSDAHLRLQLELERVAL